MNKKYFAYPYVLLTRGPGDTPGDGDDSGYGSGMGTPDATPCDFSTWQQSFACDMDGDGDMDREDYRRWWLSNHLSAEAWGDYNPGIDLNQPNP